MKLLRKKLLLKRKYVTPKAKAIPIKLGVWGGSGSCVSNARCLHPSTLILTPDGNKSVSLLKVNDQIWGRSKNGIKVKEKVLSISKSRTSSTHYLIHLLLSDMREVMVSPLHPLSDYINQFRHLKKNEIFDGARVVSVKHYYYPNQFTYDILPSGDTGNYWANGILMGSTLSNLVPERPLQTVERLVSIVEFI